MHFGFFYIIVAPIGFDQEAVAEAVVDTRQLWIWEAVSPKSSENCYNFQMLSLSKLSSFTLISTELQLIFSAGSGPFWQEAEALEEHCFGSQPSSVKCHNF